MSHRQSWSDDHWDSKNELTQENCLAFSSENEYCILKFNVPFHQLPIEIQHVLDSFDWIKFETNLTE